MQPLSTRTTHIHYSSSALHKPALKAAAALHEGSIREDAELNVAVVLEDGLALATHISSGGADQELQRLHNRLSRHRLAHRGPCCTSAAQRGSCCIEGAALLEALLWQHLRRDGWQQAPHISSVLRQDWVQNTARQPLAARVCLAVCCFEVKATLRACV
jgi:hypothetical protein